MKLLIIILILFSINCFLIEKEKRRPTRGDIFNFCGLGFFLTEPSEEFKAQDNNDGTLSYTKITTFGSSLCGTKRSTIENIFVVKKCLQGQVYRKEQNDCKGTGNAINYYGATAMQICSVIGCSGDLIKTNCEQAIIQNTALSKVSIQDLKKTRLINLFEMRKEEIPQTDLDYYWGNGLNNFKGNEKPNFLSTDFGYVLCGSQLGNI